MAMLSISTQKIPFQTSIQDSTVLDAMWAHTLEWKTNLKMVLIYNSWNGEGIIGYFGVLSQWRIYEGYLFVHFTIKRCVAPNKLNQLMINI